MPGRNLEARARAARSAVLPADVLTGPHRRRPGRNGAHQPAARRRGEPDWRRCSRVRRSRCSPCATPRRWRCVEHAGLDPVDDPSNTDRRFLRNRVRHEVLPLLVRHRRARRHPVARAHGRGAPRRRTTCSTPSPGRLDPTDARAIAAADPALARRALRRVDRRRTAIPRTWPPSIGRSTWPAARAKACELGGGRRLERHRQRLRDRRLDARATAPAVQ